MNPEGQPLGGVPRPPNIKVPTGRWATTELTKQKRTSSDLTEKLSFNARARHRPVQDQRLASWVESAKHARANNANAGYLILVIVLMDLYFIVFRGNLRSQISKSLPQGNSRSILVHQAVV